MSSYKQAVDRILNSIQPYLKFLPYISAAIIFATKYIPTLEAILRCHMWITFIIFSFFIGLAVYLILAYQKLYISHKNIRKELFQSRELGNKIKKQLDNLNSS